MKIKKEREEDPRAKKEEELWAEEREEKPTEENGFSNRQLYAAFIPPLTKLARKASNAQSRTKTKLRCPVLSREIGITRYRSDPGLRFPQARL